MGTTIGINTFILFAALFFIRGNSTEVKDRFSSVSFIILNASLLLFILSFIMAGIQKSLWQSNHPEVPFREMHATLWPWFLTMFTAGAGIVFGLGVLLVNILRRKGN